MEKERIVIVAEKVKSFAIGFIGICFTSMGATYFEEQAIYRVPRILLPIFNTLGNIGLAIAMIVLGVGLVMYGFAKWRKVSQKTLIYPIIAIPALAISVYLAFSVGAFKDKSERLSGDEQRSEQIEAIKSMDKPDFKNEAVEKHLSEFDQIFDEYKKNVLAKNEQGIIDSEEKYMAWLSRASQVFQELDNNGKSELATYMAQLAFKWNDAREGF